MRSPKFLQVKPSFIWAKCITKVMTQQNNRFPLSSNMKNVVCDLSLARYKCRGSMGPTWWSRHQVHDFDELGNLLKVVMNEPLTWTSTWDYLILLKSCHKHCFYWHMTQDDRLWRVSSVRKSIILCHPSYVTVNIFLQVSYRHLTNALHTLKQ